MHNNYINDIARRSIVPHETYVFNLHNDYTNIITNESIVSHGTLSINTI